ncbi:endonuclease/exonuclease/phosphatase family protein [Neolewinella persica]|uniref:endonuclease/exonuclease/phosphatase family protein n=1 Tax=Neolewinella persica TaxID=70998 RepID=UPI00037781A6|nr:endonuclease/exonuclease/phosphatase family protein [Neolewinella persica]
MPQPTMEKLRKIVYLILCVITVLMMLFSVLSVFRNTSSNYLKMLDFPRIQFFLGSLVTLVLFVIMTQKWRWYDYALVVGLLGGLVVNGTYLIHYTPLFPDRVPEAAADHAPEDRVSLLLTNVLMKNRTAQPLIDLIREKDPDFLIALEVDSWWDEQLRGIEQQYPYTQENTNEVAYGMALYSKYPFKNVEVNRLNNKKVPSYRATVQLPNGRDIVLNTVHPVPPKSFEDFPDNKGQKEVALRKVGQDVASSSLPNIVAGDLNDVVWGYTDLLTGTTDLLFDVRVGRGFYNSFDANSWFMRWPIDHVFVTRQFALSRLERLSKIGSDHFPIYVELVLEDK